MRKIAVKIHKDIIKVCFPGEIDCLKKGNITFEVLGYVCDFKKFGDKCSTLCYAYRHDNCRAKIIRDYDGNMWHVF